MILYGGFAMYVVNFNLKPSKKLLVIFLVLFVIVAMVSVICINSVRDNVNSTATCDEIGTYSLIAETENQQCKFLEQFNLSPIRGSATKTEVTIPSAFNSVYNEYNDLQRTIGLDLTAYKGKTADMVKYELKDSKSKYAVLLIHNGAVIGAHLTNGEYGENNMPLI